MTRVAVIGGWAPSLIKFRGPLLAAMVARGHAVTGLAADGDDAVRGQLRALGVDFAPIDLQRAGLDPLADARAIAGLVRALRRVRPEVVLGYTIKPVIYGSVAARLAGVPRRAAMITGMGSAVMGRATVKQRLVAATARGLYRVGLAQCQTV